MGTKSSPYFAVVSLNWVRAPRFQFTQIRVSKTFIRGCQFSLNANSGISTLICNHSTYVNVVSPHFCSVSFHSPIAPDISGDVKYNFLALGAMRHAKKSPKDCGFEPKALVRDGGKGRNWGSERVAERYRHIHTRTYTYSAVKWEHFRAQVGKRIEIGSRQTPCSG